MATLITNEKEIERLNEMENEKFAQRLVVEEVPSIPRVAGESLLYGTQNILAGQAQPFIKDKAMQEALMESMQQLKSEQKQREKYHPITAETFRIGGEIIPVAAEAYAVSRIPGAKQLAAGIMKNFPKLSTLGGSATMGASEAASQYRFPEEDLLKKSAEGAAYGLAGPVTYKGASYPLKSLYESSKPYAEALKTSKLGNFIGDLYQDTFGIVSKNEDILRKEENVIWDKTKQMAETSGAMGIKFPKDEFVTSINSEIKRLKTQSRNSPGLASDNQRQINLLENLKETKLDNWSDVLSARQDFNKLYRVEQTSGESPPFEAVNYAISSLLKAADNSLDKNPMPAFRDSWNAGNSMTKDINETFHQVVRPGGKPFRSAYSEFKGNPVKGSNPQRLIEQYAPKTGKEGVEKINQFYDMAGGKETGSNLLRPEVFRDAIERKEVNYDNLFNRYEKLSPAQKDLLFSPEQLQFMERNLNAYMENPRAYNPRNKIMDSSIKDLFSPSKVGVTALGGIMGGIPGAAATYAGASLLDRYGRELSGKYVDVGQSKALKAVDQYISSYLPAALASFGTEYEEKKK